MVAILIASLLSPSYVQRMPSAHGLPVSPPLPLSTDNALCNAPPGQPKEPNSETAKLADGQA